ncbi:AfsR/SARP family transcriptional regulator [Virgisporangium aurantiacum]|uniref:SARP family transcriptional regulator n=1 Tax=Virgisporangium aurantiacum TaxID=175570 RepID=A0A8J3ZP16_9ACTN|nr:BTAD domain-containing putative transcriptional regulator [Virgisporangium aurantiacum]GIJ64955.1 SARP family transcriptional regulator [Virgisporangium aurantiacum]
MAEEELRFRVLGVWEVLDGGRPVVVPAGKMRVLLAALLMSLGRPVPVGVLAARLWPGLSPLREQATVHTYVARLRRLLGQQAIQTTPGGYMLDVPDESVDLLRFRDLLSRAMTAGSSDDELSLLHEALALWGGRPFEGVASDWLDEEVIPQIEDEWSTAMERRIDLEMRVSWPGALVSELRELLRVHPTRESLWLRLIDALFASGRRADALQAFQQARSVLADQLGIDPGEDLQRLHQRVLQGGGPVAGSQVSTSAPNGVGVARQLPPEVVNFVNRPELSQLEKILTTIQQGERRFTHVVALDGAPGIGKTTLAIHLAQRAVATYQDLQLYLNLRGYGPGEPLSPSAAAETLLRGLHLHSEVIPSGVDERAALLRSTLAGRRVLMLLDNARDAAQVRHLLPGADSLVIVTSRNQLRGLAVRDGAHRVTLAPLPSRDGLALLAAAYGPDRVTAERAAAARLVELCGGLPLALAILAERAQRAGGLTGVVQALDDERMRHEVFQGGDGDPYNDLWVALSWSYRTLTADAASVFRKLGLHPAEEISLDAAAALAGMSVRRAQAALDQLVATHLVRQRLPQRYELHDLVRWYAAELARSSQNPQKQNRAVRRMLDWYLHATVAADSRLLPHRRRDFLAPYLPQVEPPRFADVSAAMAWLEREYDCLRSVIRWANENGWSGHAWRMITSLTTFFERRIPLHDAIEFHRWAIDAAAAAGERTGEGYLSNALGYMCYLRGDGPAAATHFHNALTCFQDSGHSSGEAMMLGNLGLVYGERGDHEAARRYATRALDLCTESGYHRGRGLNLDNLGVALYGAADYEGAIGCHLQAHEINRQIGDVNGEASNQRHLGLAYLALRRYRQSLRAFGEAIRMYRLLNNLRFEALVWVDIGRALFLVGHQGLAQAIWSGAVATLKEFDDPQAREVSDTIAAMQADPRA